MTIRQSLAASLARGKSEIDISPVPDGALQKLGLTLEFPGTKVIGALSDRRSGAKTRSRFQGHGLMTTFDERERGFEKRFALDAENEFKATARRNRRLGEWAAQQMGLQDAEDYAKAVVKSDFELPGDEDVLRKVWGDLKGAGLTTSEGEVRQKMDELLAICRDEIRAGK